MKREDIEKKSQECAERLANIAYAGGGHIGQDDLEMAFGNGAEWRINSVWHDASEVPDNEKMVLTIDCIGHPFVCGPNNTEWKETSLIFNVSKWAYIEDLMPTKD